MPSEACSAFLSFPRVHSGVVVVFALTSPPVVVPGPSRVMLQHRLKIVIGL